MTHPILGRRTTPCGHQRVRFTTPTGTRKCRVCRPQRSWDYRLVESATVRGLTGLERYGVEWVER